VAPLSCVVDIVLKFTDIISGTIASRYLVSSANMRVFQIERSLMNIPNRRGPKFLIHSLGVYQGYSNGVKLTEKDIVGYRINNKIFNK